MRLTEIRLAKFDDLFANAMKHLETAGSYDVDRLEQSLRDGMDCGYQELKPFMIDLAAISKYQPVAVYYMEHGGGMAPVSEFHDAIGTAYKIDYMASTVEQREDAAKAYWVRVLKKSTE